MRAIRIHATGDPNVLQLDDIPVPEPGPGEVRVKLEVIGLNFVDVYRRTGQYAITLPAILGTEVAGVVDTVGSGVTLFRPGDRVGSARIPNAYAEYAVGPADLLVPIPDGIALPVATAALLQGMTAHFLALSTFPLRAGQTALVHAAGGGVGALLTQIAVRQGARVLATVSSEEKAHVARASGASEVIFYTQTDFAAEVRRLTGGAGVDVVYDSVGKATFDKSLECLRPRGMLVLFGQASGAVPPLDPQVLNQKGSLFLTRPTYTHYIQDRAELLWRANDLFGWIGQGALTVRVDRTFPLAEAAAAHRYLESRAARGKVLLIP
jgi:NADPH2:quinone reductase